jgi:hypothetical protein
MVYVENGFVLSGRGNISVQIPVVDEAGNLRCYSGINGGERL